MRGACYVSLFCDHKHPVLPLILPPNRLSCRCAMSTPASHGIAGWVVPSANMNNVKFNFVDGRSPPSCASVGGVKRLGGRGCNPRKSWSTMSTSTCEGIPLSPLSQLRLEEEVEGEGGLSSAQVRTLSKFAYSTCTSDDESRSSAAANTAAVDRLFVFWRKI